MTEDIEYLLQHPTKDKLQSGLMCFDYLSLSFGCPPLVLAPCVFPDFRGVEQNPMIPRLEFSEFVTAAACVYFIPSRFSLTFDVLHTVINSVYVQLANRASHLSCNRFFSCGYDPYTHACKARALTTVGRTSLSVIIIIIHALPQ